MKAYLEIELIGDNMVQTFRSLCKFTNGLAPGLGSATFGDYPPSGWVAEITGFDARYRYQRKFLGYKKDYSRANSKGSRYVYAEYILESDKIYEVKDDRRRYFCKVNCMGDIEKLEEEEVQEWLRLRLELMSSLQPGSE